MREFLDEDGKAWLATVRTEGGLDYKGRHYLYLVPQGGEEEDAGRRTHGILEEGGRVDGGDAAAAGLLGGLGDDTTPALQALGPAFPSRARRSHPGAPADQRHEPGHAELRTFLQNKLEPLGPNQRLVQHQLQRGLRRRGPLGDNGGGGRTGRDGGELHLVVAASAVGQEQTVAALEAEDGGKAAGQLRRQVDLAASEKAGRDEEPTHGQPW